MPDEDGYPTEEELKKIETWDFEKVGSLFELMDYVGTLWTYPDRFAKKDIVDFFGKPVVEYYLSTGGWSGNESLIDALEKNFVFWMCCWKRSERGGHYWFEIRKLAV